MCPGRADRPGPRRRKARHFDPNRDPKVAPGRRRQRNAVMLATSLVLAGRARVLVSVAMSLAPIRELGVDLQQRWAATGFELAAFPGLCAEHLETAKLHSRVDPAEIVQAVFRGDVPPQVDPSARFGQPPVTLYRTDRFFIDALFRVCL